MGSVISCPVLFKTISRYSLRLRNVFIVILALLMCEVNACKPDQIVWKSNTRYKCLECRECPEGTQPSVPCGSSVKYGTPVHCVQCDLGRTYSKSHGKSQCRSCTVCSEGKAVKKNCTLSANTECGDGCIEGYYYERPIFKCFRCAKCCGDEHDENATDCASGENKCKIRSTAKPCKKKENSTVATNGKKPPSTVMVHDGTTSQTTTEELEETIRSTPKRGGLQQLSDDKIKVERKEKDNEKLLHFAVYSPIAAMMPLAVFAVFRFVTRQRREPIDRATDIEKSTQSQATETDSGSKPLSSLVSDLSNFVEKIFQRLDTRMKGAGHYEVIANHFGHDLFEIRSRFEKSDGGPSRAMIEAIAVRRPELTVEEFAIVVEKKAGRKDVADLLREYDRDSLKGSV